MKYYGLGRRKSAVAQVYISPKRSTKVQSAGPILIPTVPSFVESDFQIQLENIIINQKNLLDYFPNDLHFFQSLQQILKILDQPLHIRVTVSGGGSTGQKDAIRLALARALACVEGHKAQSILKKKKLLTQDARRKERKKYGLKKARKAPQYSKR